MIKGHVFKEQTYQNEMWALFQNNFLNGHDGVYGEWKQGCAMTTSGSTISIQDGAFLIQGRIVEIEGGELVTAGTDNAYCILAFVINLDRTNTDTQFNQGYFTIVKGTNSYPALTKDDIVGTGQGIYQYEFARFTTSANGIANFKDNRTFLDYPSIYDEIYQALQSVLDESLYVKRTGDTMSGPLEADIIGNADTATVAGTATGNARKCNKASNS